MLHLRIHLDDRKYGLENKSVFGHLSCSVKVWCLYCKLWTDFHIYYPYVSIIDFEQVNISWATSIVKVEDIQHTNLMLSCPAFHLYFNPNPQFCCISLCKKCLNTEFFLVRIQSECGKIWTRKKLRIWTLFTQCLFLNLSPRWIASTLFC